MIKINKKNLKSEWFDYDDDVKFLIRPFPLSERAISPSGTNVIDLLIKQSMYCLEDWKGIVDQDEKPIECNEENKRFIFDYSDDIITFVVNKSKELNEKFMNVKSKKI